MLIPKSMCVHCLHRLRIVNIPQFNMNFSFSGKYKDISEHRPASEHLISSNEWAKIVATELLAIIMSRPFTAKRAAYNAIKKCF